MFKAKYGLPYFHLKSKSSEKGYKLKNKLYGVLMHGRKHGIHVIIFWIHLLLTFVSGIPSLAVYAVPENLTCGANLTIEILHRMFQYISLENLPPCLDIQLDNTAGYALLEFCIIL